MGVQDLGCGPHHRCTEQCHALGKEWSPGLSLTKSSQKRSNRNWSLYINVFLQNDMRGQMTTGPDLGFEALSSKTFFILGCRWYRESQERGGRPKVDLRKERNVLFLVLPVPYSPSIIFSAAFSKLLEKFPRLDFAGKGKGGRKGNPEACTPGDPKSICPSTKLFHLWLARQCVALLLIQRCF